MEKSIKKIADEFVSLFDHSVLKLNNLKTKDMVNDFRKSDRLEVRRIGGCS